MVFFQYTDIVLPAPWAPHTITHPPKVYLPQEDLVEDHFPQWVIFQIFYFRRPTGSAHSSRLFSSCAGVLSPQNTLRGNHSVICNNESNICILPTWKLYLPKPCTTSHIHYKSTTGGSCTGSFSTVDHLPKILLEETYRKCARPPDTDSVQLLGSSLRSHQKQLA